MIDTESHKNLVEEQIGYLFSRELTDEILRTGKIKTISEGTVLLNAGEEILNIPFILDGSVKISRENENGEEILLYYIESGDTCAMTLQCCVRKSRSEIRATALEETTILIIPIQYMEEWMNKYPSWRSYILESYHQRMTELMQTIDAIAFLRLDERLDKYLKDQAKLLGSLEINYTHQRIADDLHSSRVVISRLLKQMESKKMIRLHRNRIVLKSI